MYNIEMYYRLALLVIVVLVSLPFVYAQAEPRTFINCYEDFTKDIIIGSMFTPTTIDLHDPQVKQFFTNACNFYYEKSGEWIDYKTFEPNPQWGDEFLQKYGDTIPESLKELFRYYRPSINNVE